ncbi:MAG: response regulator [Myxococcaceae bacterium]
MKVLFVENHRVFAQTVVKQFLSAHEVTVVGSIAEAQRAAGFDVALVDYDLDDGKGDAFVVELRGRGFRGRVIAISSHEAGNAALVRAGADAVCSKMEFARIDELIR